ncbi:PAS domain S-box protein [Komarekiella sp. 'clone 1']|uniref:histidine kinase n=1 Tax=Komarekiella delphini-convector SJRDD-AB1 TaxID=2593771 RepID=A0AA40VU77_9NOST|nr:PAS domain S-box protein [Komarekiella delphini-convector]MBD6619917.1 PAS domain S-box protein [Komarekiella delphini-convector SJRDD-AB1]
MQEDNTLDQPQELASNCPLRNPQENLSVAFLLQIIDCLEDPIFVKDHQHRWVLLNDAFCKFLGHNREELIGKSDYDFFPKAEADVFWEKDELVFTTGITNENEESFTDTQGQTRFISTRKCLFEGDAGSKFLVGTIRDITQYKQVEAEQRQSKHLLQLVMDNIPQSIFWKDRNSVYLGCNRNFARDACVIPDQIVGLNDYDLPWKKEESDWYRECDRRVMESGIPELHIIETQQKADGKQYWSDINKIPLHDTQGNVVGILGTYEDITERKLTEEALRQSEAKLQKLSANVPGMLYQFMLHPNGSLSLPYVNSGSYDLYGLTPEEIQADPSLIISIVHADEHEDFVQSISVSAQTLQPWQWEGRIVLPDGQVKWLQGVSRPEQQADGSILWDGLIIDITRSKQAEKALQQAYAELERRVEERTQQLAQSNEALQVEIAERQQAEVELRASQQRLALLIQQTPIGVIEWNTKFEVQEWNPAAERIFGYSRSEVLGRYFEFLVPETVREHVKRLTDALLRQQGGTSSVNENITIDNRTIICEWYNSPLVAMNGDVIGVASMVLDITERKQAEQSLILYKQAVESSSDAIAIADAAGNHIYQNPAFCKLYECETVKDFIAFGGFSAVFTDSVVAQEIWQATISGQSWIGEIEQQSAGGRSIQTFLRSYALKDSTGQNIGLVGAITDITERKRAETQLQEKEQFLRSVYDGTENPIFVLDIVDESECYYTGWNPATERATGISSKEIIGVTPDVAHGLVEGAGVRQRYLRCVEVGTSITYEECLTFQDQKTWWLTTINPLKDSEGRIYRLVATTHNITERVQAETQLKLRTEDLEIALQELQKTQMQLVQSEKMSGLGQLVAGVAHEINNPVNFIYGNLTHANDYIQDLVGLVQIYQQSYPHPTPQVQELAAEIELEFLIEDLPKLLNSMKVGAQRIREIVLSLRNFSRMDEADMKEVNIHEGIDSTLMILEHRIKATPNRCAIQVIKEYSDLPLVECYAGQLNQVFMNILANAIDALEESLVSGHFSFVNNSGQKDKSEHQIEANRMETNDTAQSLSAGFRRSELCKRGKMTSPQIKIYTQLLEPNQVTIRITDNGLGISKEVKQRLFDPFFSTKPIGQGTGMGLSISYQIISQKHGGTLECISQLGCGAEFVISIPLRQG